MDCVNCGAPLPPDSYACTFCDTLNDVDLRAIERAAETGPATDRRCPRCGTCLVSVSLQFARRLFIERCDTCLGIFFNPGELETVIDASVSHVHDIDHGRMREIVEEEAPAKVASVAYIHCPVCGTLMNRKRFGARCGVVVDRCKRHGVWLDGGELGRILKWTKAGGRLHDFKRREEEKNASERKRRREKRAPRTGSFLTEPRPTTGGDLAALAALLRAVMRLFG